MEEIWKDILGFEGLYKVSSSGLIKALARRVKYTVLPQHIMKPNPETGGYLGIYLCRDGVKTRRSIHRIVAETFIPNPGNKSQVNHINGIKTDNRVDNLQWSTSHENMQHAVRLGLTPSGEKNHLCRLSSATIDEMRRIKKETNIKTEDLGKMYGVSRAHAYRIINFERRKLG